MARKSPESFFDPDNDTHKKTPAQRADSFIPIEQIPDPNPDPSELLMRKEEGEDREGYTQASSQQSNEGGTVDVSAYRRNDFADREPFGQHIPSGLSEGAEKIVEHVEENLLKDKKPESWDVRLYDSHGKRGRKPPYKDLRTPPSNLNT